MAANPGFYGFSTGTQIDRVQQHSRETQTSPMRTSGLAVEDLRDELGKANRALLMAFGF
jgi:phage-related protein